ncbi:MAG: hypothetical protein K6E36_03640 [Oscillospiraceae bacterium]|nr:hypothetical protein [Oscillospiraceae bacterium]
MKKCLSLCCAFGILLSSGMPVQAAAEAESPVQYDISAYVEEHFCRSDGAAVHFLDPTEQAFCERIAGWENVTLDECILLRTPHGGMQVLTPTKPYWVQLVQEYPWRFYTSGDKLPDADKVLEQWKEMLRAANYPEKSLDLLGCKITPAEEGYDIACAPYVYGDANLTDCLKRFPEVACIDVQCAYRTDDRVNHITDYHGFLFQCDRTPVPADFPDFDVLDIRQNAWDGSWTVCMNGWNYADYFAAVPEMLQNPIVHDLQFFAATTMMLDDNEDAQMLMPERTVLYQKGDVDGDGSVNAAQSLTEIIRSIEEDRRCEIIPTDTPTSDCISYAVQNYTYEGVAVTCADIEALKQNGLNGIPIEWSDGFWSGYWHPSETKFLLQPIEGLSKEFGFYAKYEPSDGEELPDDGKENSFPLPAECTGLDEPVYVLYAPKADAGRLEAALAADSSVTVLGALFCGILDPMEYTGADFSVILDESAGVTDQFFRMYGFELKETGEANRYALSELESSPHSFEETLALYNLFSEVEGVEKVEWYGTCIDIMPFRAAATTTKIVPFTATALMGDLDGDGEITAYDASLALTGFNEATVLGLEPGDRTLTPAQEALADVDGDGALTAYDATCILTYFTLKSNAGFDDLTWADVLPNP